MKKTLKLIFTAALVLLGTFALTGAEDAVKVNPAVKDVYFSSLNSMVEGKVTEAFSYWCEDGYAVENGKKKTVAQLRKELGPLESLLNAKDFDALVDAMIDSGFLPAAQKQKFAGLKPEQKKQMFAAFSLQVNMLRGKLRAELEPIIQSIRIESYEEKGETALLSTIQKSDRGKQLERCVVTFKKINGVWKIHSTVAVPLKSKEKK